MTSPEQLDSGWLAGDTDADNELESELSDGNLDMRQPESDENRKGAELEQGRAPELSSLVFFGQIRENERSVKMQPKLSIANPEVELCDFELLPAEKVKAGKPGDDGNKLRADSDLFAITWIDRVNGWAKLEAKDERSMDCERQANYTFRIRAVACNGLKSKE